MPGHHRHRVADLAGAEDGAREPPAESRGRKSLRSADSCGTSAATSCSPRWSGGQFASAVNSACPGEGRELSTHRARVVRRLLDSETRAAGLTQFGLILAGGGWPFSIIIGASVRLRAPQTRRLSISSGSRSPSLARRCGPLERKTRPSRLFFLRADVVARLALPPLFLHFALVFPDRPNAGS